MKKYSSGNATVTVQEDMTEMFMGFLKLVAPGAEAIMDAELKRIEKEAKSLLPKEINKATIQQKEFQKRASRSLSAVSKWMPVAK